MDLAPLAAPLHAVLARLPFAITEELYPGTVHQQVKRAIGASIRDLDSQSSLPPTQGRIVGHSPIQVCQLRAKLATIPVVCLSGSLNSTLIVRQNWIAASEKTAGRPGLPSGAASQVMPLSSQINSEPRLQSEAV
jgi:hypothetical protein